MTPDRTTGFWFKGKASRHEQLRNEEAKALAPLKEKLKEADDPSCRQEVLDKIRSIKEHYRRKRKDADESLFLHPPQ